MEAAQGPGVTLENYFPCSHLLHVPTWEMVISIPTLSSPQESYGVMMTVKVKVKTTKTLPTSVWAGH